MWLLWQAHLSSCPVLTQISIILALPMDQMEDDITTQSLAVLQGSKAGGNPWYPKTARTRTVRSDNARAQASAASRGGTRRTTWEGRSRPRLLLRRDQDLQQLSQQDTFVLFLAPLCPATNTRGIAKPLLDARIFCCIERTFVPVAATSPRH